MRLSHAKNPDPSDTPRQRDELERFKTAINLTEYAASEGYQLDRRASSRNSVVMRHPGGDKIVIARGEDDHWIYFSVRDDSDNGSIIDFIQHRRRCSIGEVRQELRPWVGGSFVRPVPELYVPEVVPVSRDRAGVIRALAGMRPLITHRYLEEERGIPRSLLEHPRFAGRVLVDARSNVVFPHADRDGPCGYEVKNRGFTGFAPGGEKGLWISRVQRTDTALVLAESGIDALSYAALHPDDNARYASFGGTMNPSQPALIRAAIERLAPGATVRIATDNDEDGAGFAADHRGAGCGDGEGGSGGRAGRCLSMPRTGTMCFCVRAGWLLQSVDRIPWYVPYFSALFLPNFSDPFPLGTSGRLHMTVAAILWETVVRLRQPTLNTRAGGGCGSGGDWGLDLCLAATPKHSLEMWDCKT